MRYLEEDNTLLHSSHGQHGNMPKEERKSLLENVTDGQ